ncbi:MAG TPA: choice-of-anchor Q domain-containing protein, partial [Candidatus Hydrogenedentes bacterium]|nr:choice-of-anchor Q domain-containing protein [Candidatus Hydrogenedentota bacterium]HPK03019.1 choice-of-anchor Q domain-containing protein [Candidatus Sumerlaeota bacterium]
GENMLPEGVTSVAGGNDPINYGGQVIANPLLDSDGIHLTEGSPAINAASDIGVTDDFDGGARPYDGGFDFGADEFGSEPPPPPNSVRHWNPY